jgi:DNA polymerase (family 10)
MQNQRVADILDEVADLLEIQEANPFRVRAYRSAAQTVRAIPEPLEDDPKKLIELPGVGKDLAERIASIVRTGDMPLHQELLKQVPAGVVMMTRIPSLGPHRARKIYDALHINTPEELADACLKHQISKLPGFGAKMEGRILANLQARPISERGCMIIARAEREGERILRYLGETPGLEQIEIVGSYRRRKETIGDLDLLAVCKDPEAVLKRFSEYPEKVSMTMEGPKRSQLRLGSGIDVDLRVFAREEYGAALHYFTGNANHNIAIRVMGKKKGLHINEYGVFRGEKRIGGEKEEDVFKAVGLPWIPPELREGGREIEAAQKNELPTLVETFDLKGDLHVHTNATDGRNSLEEMVKAARTRGYEYMAITDHSQNVRIARGLTPEQARKHWKKIDELADTAAPFRILKGVELDILQDGSLDWPPDILQEADWVLGAVHFGRGLSSKEMTKRILKAIESGFVHAIAHPTGRLINRRPPIEFDLEAVLDACLQYHVALEIDGTPERLDLSAEMAYRARERGVRLVIDSDSHSVAEYDFVRYGVYQARRAWVTKESVLNALSLGELLKFLKQRRRLI